MRTDPGDIAVWGCAAAAAIIVACIVTAVVAATYTFVVWCFS